MNRRGSKQEALYAAVDLGTHNCRMLIARPDPDAGFRVVLSFSRPVRLGERLGDRGILGEAAIVRAIDALRVCANRIRRSGVRRVRGIATEACRQAGNTAEFLRRVKRETGLVLEPVSAATEAEYTLAGCLPLVDPAYPRLLLFDIGGGSTEISWIAQAPGQPPQILGLVSLPIGVVSFAERFGGDCVDGRRYDEMVDTVDARLAPMESRFGIAAEVAAGRVQMIGTSGTVTTLAAAHLGLERYDRARVDGVVVDFADVAQVSARLAASSWAERAANPCIGPERADLVIAGCAIFHAVARRWPVGRLRVADRGIREGLLLAMIAEDGAPVRLPPSLRP